jgi:16S rRNA (guanine966-N2)-methyltransferase
MSLRLSGGRKLQSPPGDRARPTSSRVRLAVMNLLAAELPGCRWLDLCSGSGVMACEALHRGAAVVVAVEQDRRIAATARTNLEAVCSGLQPRPQVQVHTSEVLRWLAGHPSGTTGGRVSSQGAPGFDLIYADPPYASGLYAPLAAAIAAQGWLVPGGMLVWECASSATPAIPPGWECVKERRYGSTTVLLLEQLPPQPLPGDSAAEHAAAAVLIPGGHEQTQQRHGDQTEHDAAEQGFDHGKTEAVVAAQFFHDHGQAVSPAPQQAPQLSPPPGS